MYYNSKIDLFFTLGATSSGAVVWRTWLESMRRPHAVRLYPYLRGNRPFILPQSLSIGKWENGKIVMERVIEELGRKIAQKMATYLSVHWRFFDLIHPENACWLWPHTVKPNYRLSDPLKPAVINNEYIRVFSPCPTLHSATVNFQLFELWNIKKPSPTLIVISNQQINYK